MQRHSDTISDIFELSVLGCTHVCDFYPNVKYKMALLEAQHGFNVTRVLYDLGEDGHFRDYWQSPARRAYSFLRMAWGSLSVFLRFLARRSPKIYLLYPSLPLTLCFACLPERLRPALYLDAFISLYDTVVNDRALVPATHWLARLLFKLERYSFTQATRVLVDTDENGAWYAALFDVPRERFATVRLSIPPLPAPQTLPPKEPGVFRCVFVGSLIPLHGVDVILGAAALLSDHAGLEFVLIGDGQEAVLIQEFQARHPDAKVRWERGAFPTTYVTQAITSADLCLGVFGSSAKAQRVVPYKLYYYSALGRPFLNLDTAPVRELCVAEHDELLVAPGAAALAQAIMACMNEPERLTRMAHAAEGLYRTRLAPEVVRRQLLEVLR
jgi:glycosyltransferase involved in cell wall biosynthesis